MSDWDDLPAASLAHLEKWAKDIGHWPITDGLKRYRAYVEEQRDRVVLSEKLRGIDDGGAE